MPVLLALLAALGTAAYYLYRARSATKAAGDLLDMANDVRLAARRFGFKRRANLHPAEGIEDPKIAIAAIGSAFIELEDTPTAEEREALNWALANTLHISKEDADELSTLGRWMVRECGGADPAISRLSRKLARLDAAGFPALLTALNETLSASGGLGPKQSEALEDIKRAFRIK